MIHMEWICGRTYFSKYTYYDKIKIYLDNKIAKYYLCFEFGINNSRQSDKISIRRPSARNSLNFITAMSIQSI
jgi:hypothetical protein